MNCWEVGDNNLALAGGHVCPAALVDFGLDGAQTERVFAAFDEDYHISRYFHFSRATGTAYTINGFDHTHVSIDADIQSILYWYGMPLPAWSAAAEPCGVRPD